MATRTDVGSRIRQMRERKCWSQADLAELVATSIPSVSRWERGTASPRHYHRRKLCELFECTPEELGFFDAGPQTIMSKTHSPASSDHQSDQPAATSAAPSVATSFPLPHAVPLIGRDDSLAALKRTLLACQDVALHGLPGIGKTAVALALLHDIEISACFADGVLWAPLGRAPNLHALLSSWGVALGISTTELSQCPDIAALERLLVATVGQRRLLFIVDDVWSLADAQRFHIGGSPCAHLITTRMPDIAIRFAGPAAVALREISDEDGVSLLGRLAPEVVTGAPDATRALVASVGGLPLALTLIGRHLSVLAQSGQPRRVSGAMEQLRRAEERLRLAEPLPLVERHPSLTSGVSLSLQAAIEVSDQELDTAVRTALYALSVFEPKPNSFSEEAALAVCGTPAETLDTLYDVGLLESCGPARYTIHQTISDYARLHLHDSAPRERMFAYFAAYARDHATDFAALDADATNILTALQAELNDSPSALFAQGAQAMVPFLEARGLYDAAESLLARVQPIASDLGDHRAHAYAWLHRGRIAALRGDLALAESLYEQALTIARRQNEREIMCTALAYWSEVAINRGAYKRAESSLHEGLKYARALRAPALTAILLRLMGEVEDIAAHHEHAETLYREALELARQAADAENISALLQNLGEQQIQRGHDQQAYDYFVEGLAVARQVGHRQRLSALLNNLGTLALRGGEMARAEELYQQSLHLAQTIENRIRVINAMQSLGRLAMAREQPAQAERHLQESLRVARDIKHPFLASESLYQLGELFLSAGRLGEAERAFGESVALVEAVDAPDMGTLSLYGLARVAAARGETRKACTLGTRAVERLRVEGDERSDEVALWVRELPPEDPLA